MNFSNKEDHDIDDADSHSHHIEAHEEAELINERLMSAKKSLKYLKSIPLSETEEVALGSLIETSKFFIYIGISTQKFTEDGNNIIGISTSAPIYQTLQSKTVGDTFKFGPDDCEILSIK